MLFAQRGEVNFPAKQSEAVKFRASGTVWILIFSISRLFMYSFIFNYLINFIFNNVNFQMRPDGSRVDAKYPRSTQGVEWSVSESAYHALVETSFRLRSTRGSALQYPLWE